MTSKMSAMAPPPPPTKPDTPLLLLPLPPSTSATTTSSSSGNTSGGGGGGGGGAISNHEPLPRLPLPPSRAVGATKVQKPRSSKPSKAQLRRPRRTNAFICLAAVLCFVFSVSIILAGATTLFVFLVIKLKYPSSRAASAASTSTRRST